MSKESSGESDETFSASSKLPTIQSLLFESLNREKDLKRLLNEQLLKNDQLQLQLEIEKKKIPLNGNQEFKKSFR